MNPLKPVILCVDDEEANLKLLEKLLVPRGYVVVSAVSGKDALLKIKSQSIDLVLLDIIMPGMDGFEVCRQIKEDQKLGNIPVIMITASSVKQDRILGIEAGAEEFLSKPFDLAEVLARIKMLLKMKKLDDERKRAESQRAAALAALQQSHDEMERRVRERTAELAQANEMLQADIIERNLAQKELLIIKKAVESSSDSIGISDPQGHHFYHNKAFSELLEYTPEELGAAGGGPAVYANKDIAGEVFNAIMSGGSWSGELEMISKSGRKIPLLLRADAIKDESGKIIGLMGLHTDITGRKQAEEALRENEEKYRMVVENAKEAIIVTQDMQVVFVNRAGLDMIGYSEKVLKPQPITDFIHPDDIDMVADHHLRRMNGEDVQTAYSFRIISQDGTVKWVEINAALIKWKERPATLNFLSDITERKLVEAELLQTLESLRKAVNTTVGVMVSAVEMKDPYTAGHQNRSADLACAIAAEMGLAQEKIDGIRMAGSIHDIGKLSVPSEILSKPTKLTNAEFSVIKDHAQSGYEMLKNVDSPWPLAQIVYQHHERMDGSGYPRKLKGDEILLDARIMAVADVVEAMASHRPYRPSLGIDVALEEIKKNKGILYDDNVAEACLRLFREKGYKLPT